MLRELIEESVEIKLNELERKLRERDEHILELETEIRKLIDRLGESESERFGHK